MLEPSASSGRQPVSFGDLSSGDADQPLLSLSRGCCAIRPEKDPVVLLVAHCTGPGSARLVQRAIPLLSDLLCVVELRKMLCLARITSLVLLF